MTVLIYTRKSVDRNNDKVSVVRQEFDCRALADRLYPGVPVEVFTDSNVSGSVPLGHRPGGSALMARLPAAEALIVVEQSRLTRDLGEWDSLAKQLVRCGLKSIDTLSGTIDLVDRMSADMHAVVDVDERRRAAVRARDRHAHARVKGYPVGPAPYGFRQDGPRGARVRIEEPAEADRVREALRRVLAGDTLTAIAADMGKTRKGGAWTQNGVRVAISNPAVVGLRAHRAADGHSWVIDGPAAWEGIVPREKWDVAMAALNGAPGRRGATKRRFLLSGLLVCGREGCGAGMRGSSLKRRSGRVIPCYRCNSCGMTISGVDEVDEYVMDAVLAWDPSTIAASMADRSESRRAVEDELQAARKGVEQLAVMLGAGTLSAVAYGAAAPAAEARLAAAEKALERISGGAALDLPAWQVVVDSWATQPNSVRRSFLAVFLDRIAVAPATLGSQHVGLDRLKLVWHSS